MNVFYECGFIIMIKNREINSGFVDGWFLDRKNKKILVNMIKIDYDGFMIY